jgi:hypothetical protein
MSENKITEAYTNAMDSVSKLEVPEGARAFVKRGVNVALDRTEDLHVNSLKATNAVESALGKSVAAFAHVNRKFQDAAFEDGKAFLNMIEKLASARTFADAARVPVDYVRERNEVAISRVKAAYEYVSEAVKENAENATAQAKEIGAAVKDQAEKTAKAVQDATKAA